MTAFQVRQQYIGQLEIMVVLAAFLSVGDRLAGMDVMYWGDNSSAIAGVVKGYSARPDSARLVHAIHALLTRLRVRV